jgi:hypothetical protein
MVVTSDSNMASARIGNLCRISGKCPITDATWRSTWVTLPIQ